MATTDARPSKPRRRWAVRALAVVAVLVALAFAADSYWRMAWQASASSLFDGYRHDQLRVLYKALSAYRESHRAWPPSLEDVADSYAALLRERGWPHVDLPPQSGPQRVEDFPSAPGGVLLRSYGHTEHRAGWDLRREPRWWDMHADGQIDTEPYR